MTGAPREHPNSQIRALTKSFEAFGQVLPILIDAEGRIISGAAQWVVAKRLGMLEVMVTERGKRRLKSKLDITAAQIANQGAGGNLPAAKMALNEARKAEERAEANAVRAPVMTKADHEIAARVIARLTMFIVEGG